MARHKVASGDGEKPSAEARTQTLPGIAGGEVEAEIARHQNEALARTLGKDPPPALGAAFFGAQAPSSLPSASTVISAAIASMDEVFASASRKATESIPVDHDLSEIMASNDADIGDQVTATHGTELYGKPGTFSTYEVGPFTSCTKVRKGETRAGAIRRLLAELREVATEEREKAHVEFANHFLTKVVGK